MAERRILKRKKVKKVPEPFYFRSLKTGRYVSAHYAKTHPARVRVVLYSPPALAEKAPEPQR